MTLKVCGYIQDDYQRATGLHRDHEELLLEFYIRTLFPMAYLGLLIHANTMHSSFPLSILLSHQLITRSQSVVGLPLESRLYILISITISSFVTADSLQTPPIWSQKNYTDHITLYHSPSIAYHIFDVQAMTKFRTALALGKLMLCGSTQIK